MKKLIFGIILAFFACAPKARTPEVALFFDPEYKSPDTIVAGFQNLNIKTIALKRDFKENAGIINHYIDSTAVKDLVILYLPDSLMLNTVAFFHREKIPTFLAGAFHPYHFRLGYKELFITGVFADDFIPEMLKKGNAKNGTFIVDNSVYSSGINYILEKNKVGNILNRETDAISINNKKDVFLGVEKFKRTAERVNVVLFPFNNDNQVNENIISSKGLNEKFIEKVPEEFHLFPEFYLYLTLNIISEQSEHNKFLEDPVTHLKESKLFNNLNFLE